MLPPGSACLLHRTWSLSGGVGPPAVVGLRPPSGIDGLDLRPFPLQPAQRSFVEGAQNRMIHEFVRTRHVNLELDDGGAARRHQRRLNMFRVTCTRLSVDPVENLSDHMEARHEVRAAVSDVETDSFADFGFE